MNPVLPLLLAAAPAPAPSAPPPAAVVAPVPDLLPRAAERVAADDCPGALALLDPALAGLPADVRTAAQLLRLPCLARVNRLADAAAAQKELAAAAPANPMVRAFGVILTLTAGRTVEGADALAALAAEDSRALAILTADLWRLTERALVEAGDLARRDRVALALARANWRPADAPDLPGDLALGAIRALLAEGRGDEAEPFLAEIDQPELLAAMAMERRYRPLWPAIEARLGPHGTLAADRFAAPRLAAQAAGPPTPETRLDAARAFLVLGRLDDVRLLGDTVAVAEGLSDEDAQLIALAAQARAAGGDRPGAIALLGRLAALDPARTPASGRAVVSLAELLDEADRPAEGLKAAREGLARHQALLSPWGRAWLRRTEVCTLSTLGRAAEAKPIGDALIAAAKENEAATTEALLCARRDAEAARVATAALATPDGAARILDQFQPADAFYAAVPSRLRDQWPRLLARPEVKAAFDRAGRILPPTLRPAKGERPLPRLPQAGPTT